MKIILTEDQCEQLTEMIKLDIKVGDTIMGGKFKNKKVVVKTIGKNDKGDITINGKPLLRFRVLKEGNYKLLRRESDMEKKINNQLRIAKLQNDLYFTPLEHLILHIADNVAIEMVRESNITDTDEWVTFRNQIKQHIRTRFYEHIKEFWESHQNINESTSTSDKNKKFLISVMGMDFTDKIQQITSTHDVPTSFDDGIAPSTIRTYLNFWGPMYLVKIDGENYLYQDRGDFEMFIDEEGFDYSDDEIPEKLGIGILGLRFSDIVDMYFEEEDHR